MGPALLLMLLLPLLLLVLVLPLCRKLPLSAALAGRSNRPRPSASGQQLPSSCRCGNKIRPPHPT